MLVIVRQPREVFPFGLKSRLDDPFIPVLSWGRRLGMNREDTTKDLST